MQTVLVLTQGITADAYIGITRPVSTDPDLSTQRIAGYLKGQSGGAYTSGISILETVDSSAATDTLTITSTGPTNGETFSLLGTTFTAETSGATGNQFNINASPTVVAANIAAAVNASATALINRNVTATSALGVVTFTATVPGTIGNFLSLSESLTNATVASALFTGGTDGTNSYVFDLL